MPKYDHYAQRAPTSIGKITSERTRAALYKLVASMLHGQSNVLEIGPGTGEFARWCIARGHCYVCYDENEEIIENAKKLGAQVRLHKVPPLLPEDRQFDLVFLSHMLEHVPDAERAYMLMQDIARLLKKGGRVLVFSPNFHNWRLDFWEVDYTHAYPVTPHRLRTLLSDCGMTVVLQKHMYAHLSFLPGWFLDRVVTAAAGLLQLFFPFSSKLVKARTMFHQNLLMAGRKD